MTITDLIAQLQNPNNQTANYLRGNMNQAVSSGSQNINNISQNQGWGGRSGLTAKLQAQNQGAGLQGLQTGLAQAEGNRMGQLGGALQFEDTQKFNREGLQFGKDKWGQELGFMGQELGFRGQELAQNKMLTQEQYGIQREQMAQQAQQFLQQLQFQQQQYNDSQGFDWGALLGGIGSAAGSIFGGTPTV